MQNKIQNILNISKNVHYKISMQNCTHTNVFSNLKNENYQHIQ